MHSGIIIQSDLKCGRTMQQSGEQTAQAEKAGVSTSLQGADGATVRSVPSQWVRCLPECCSLFLSVPSSLSMSELLVHDFLSKHMCISEQPTWFPVQVLNFAAKFCSVSSNYIPTEVNFHSLKWWGNSSLGFMAAEVLNPGCSAAINTSLQLHSLTFLL